MMDPTSRVSDAFRAFMSEAPRHAQAWNTMAARLAESSAVLIGLPAAGLGVTQVLPAAIAAYDAP